MYSIDVHVIRHFLKINGYWVPETKFIMQACVAYQGELAAELASLRLAYEDSQADLAVLRAETGSDQAIFGALGASDAILAALYAGGVLWRRYYGPDGPIYLSLIHI